MEIQPRVNEKEHNLWSIETDFVRSWLLVGEREALLIDTGMGDFDWHKVLSGITSLPVLVVNTHGHEDHCKGDNQFAQVYVHPDQVPGILAFGGMDDVAFLPLTDGQILDLGGTRVEALVTPGHAPGSMSFLDITHRRLFTGDLVNYDSVIMSPEGGGYPTQAYRDTMDRLYAMQDAFDGVYSDHNIAPLSPDWLCLLRDCAEGVLNHTIPPEPYSFSPCEGVPPLEGELYRNGEACLLYIQEFPDL